MDIAQAAKILEQVERSAASPSLRRQWLEAAVRYAEIRVTWLMADTPGQRAMDPARSAAHNVFIDACNILSRAMGEVGESNRWRAEIGLERKEIGDFACLLHSVLGIRAR